MKIRTKEEISKFWADREPKFGKTFEESCKILKQWSIKEGKLYSRWSRYCYLKVIDDLRYAYHCRDNNIKYERPPAMLRFEEFILKVEFDEDS